MLNCSKATIIWKNIIFLTRLDHHNILKLKLNCDWKEKNNEHKNLAPYYHHTYQCEADLQSQFKTQFDQWQDYKIIHESALTQIPY